MPIQTSAVDVLASGATQLVAANAKRTLLMIDNTGPNTIYLGTSSVTTSTGMPVRTNGSAAFSNDGKDASCTEAWFAIAATADQAGTADTRVLEGIG